MNLLIILYLAAIVAANWSIVTFGANAAIVNAFLFIGLDLTTRDSLHEIWQYQNLWLKMFVLIAAGSLLSAVLNWHASHIALASFIAFACAGLADTLVYRALAPRGHFTRVNGSNIISASIDSVIFPALAFGLPLLVPIVIGQFLAKIIGGFIWALALDRYLKRRSSTPL